MKIPSGVRYEAPSMNALVALDQNISLSDKISVLFGTLRERFEFLDHMSVAVYDPDTDLLKTFLDSADVRPALSHYQARLSDVPSLKHIVDTGMPRIIDDTHANFTDSAQLHTQRILKAGYRSSYTLPIYNSGIFYGFIFFNALEPNQFTNNVIAHLDPIGRLLGLNVVNEIMSIHKMTAAIKTIRHITSRRDHETGAHLDRMSRYSRLIARELAPHHNLSDEYVEHIFMFAPLHDIGKIAIPDAILLKPGPLIDEEWDVMKQHTERGLEMVDMMVDEFELRHMTNVSVLRNIVYHHHEWMNGSGYPQGLAGNDIPLEARIVTVADMFDALTSTRPYKEAWSNERAFSEMSSQAGEQLDPQCVQALIDNLDEILSLQSKFAETEFS